MQPFLGDTSDVKGVITQRTLVAVDFDIAVGCRHVAPSDGGRIPTAQNAMGSHPQSVRGNTLVDFQFGIMNALGRFQGRQGAEFDKGSAHTSG